MAKDGTARGGARAGSGRKSKALKEKLDSGNPGGRKLTVMELPADSDLSGEDMPEPKNYMLDRQKNGGDLDAEDVFRETWLWLKERGCERLVNPRLIEAYAQAFARYIQCEEATSTYGLLGNHRLICGDSTEKDTYTLLMDGKKANLVVTDPPYNVNYEGSAGKIKNDNLENDKFYQFLLDAFQNTEKAMADDASIYVFHADTEGLNFRKAFADAGFYLSGTCIWKKQSLVLGRSPYQWQHEPVLFGWKKNGDHPTMKPVPLIAYPIKNSSVANCIVLDPFGGSGSTLIACEKTNRICCTSELDEKYCDVIVKRYIEQVGTTENMYVVRDGQTIKFDDLEVSADEQ